MRYIKTYEHQVNSEVKFFALSTSQNVFSNNEKLIRYVVTLNEELKKIKGLNYEIYYDNDDNGYPGFFFVLYNIPFEMEKMLEHKYGVKIFFENEWVKSRNLEMEKIPNEDIDLFFSARTYNL